MFWANSMKKDLARTVNNAENIRKHLFRKPISVLNVYFSLYKPVDAYDMYIDKPIVQKKMRIDSLLIDSENAVSGLGEIDQRLGTSVSGLGFLSEPAEEDKEFFEKKLNNPNFVAKAPEALVAQQKESLAKVLDKIKMLQSSIEEIENQ